MDNDIERAGEDSAQYKLLDSLAINEQTQLPNGWLVMRVPGGFIYSEDTGASAVFVPVPETSVKIFKSTVL